MSTKNKLLKHIKDNPIKMIYIMGAGYSGSTLLAFILASHPKISTVGEVGSLGRYQVAREPSKYLCSCRETINNCKFWNDLSKEFREIGITINNFQFNLPYPTSNIRNRFLHRAINLYQFVFRKHTEERSVLLTYLINKMQKGEIFLNGMKSPFLALLSSTVPYFDTYIIHLTRNGYGQIYSRLKHHSGILLKNATMRLLRADNYCELIKKFIPKDRILHIRYEDLCGNTDKALKRISDFAGLDPNLFPSNLIPQEHHIIGNDMRLKVGNEIKLELDEAWRNELTQGKMDQIRIAIGKRNTRYGYDIN